MSSAVAASPLKGKLSARIAMAAAYAPMADRGSGAVNAVVPPDVLMAHSAASARNAEDQAYACMGKCSVGAVNVGKKCNRSMDARTGSKK